MKNNKLLAEYLELTYTERAGIRGYVYPNDANLDIYDFNPDSNWNHLMKVVDEIEHHCENPKDFLVSFWRDEWDIETQCRGVVIRGQISKGKTMIEAVYNACVEYIKQL